MSRLSGGIPRKGMRMDRKVRNTHMVMRDGTVSYPRDFWGRIECLGKE